VTGAYEVAFLVTESAPITLVDAPLNAAERSQIQRIDTASDRASWDDRRATPHPDDDPFLASGAGEHRERRELSVDDAREGARIAPQASVAGDRALGRGQGGGHGALEGTSTTHEASLAPSAETGATIASRGGSLGTAEGAERASPGRGIIGGEGSRATERARVATGRPSVDLGPAATVAEREGPVRDDADAELLAAQLFESRADASRRAGAREGAGRGGTPGAPGEGSGDGHGIGGSAAPYGPGNGAFAALDTSDSRYRTWLLAQRRRIEERLVFPRPRQLARDQGTSVVRVVIRRDGSTVSAPRVIRSSGFDDLDSAALLAVRGSLPFTPIPSDLAVGQREISVTLPIEFANPMVD
jgi:TonB family protein